MALALELLSDKKYEDKMNCVIYPGDDIIHKPWRIKKSCV